MGGKSKRQTVGYKYFLGLHVILCHGVVDRLARIRVGDRDAFTGGVITSGLYEVTGKTKLFGGDKREGGVGATGIPVRKSTLSGGGIFDRLLGQLTPPGTTFGTGGDFEFNTGTETETTSDYLEQKITGDVPAYRGVCGVVFRSFYFGNNPYIKDFSFQLERYPDVIPGASSEKLIGTDANPAHIIWEVLTNVDWGMGYLPADLDLPSFQSASTTLFNEGFGLSLVWGQSQSIENFISQIVSHINGSLFLDRQTGRFVLTLVRADYVAASLPLFNGANIIEMRSFSRRGWGETINELTVVYVDSATGKSVPVSLQDMANIQIQGTTINQTNQYPGISNQALALQVAQRDLSTLSTPLSKVKFRVNRTAWDLNFGDVFRLSWPKFGISEVVFRVAAINYGTLANAQIEVDAIEDVFGLPTATYGTPQFSGWVEPRSEPQIATNRKIFESNYWDIVQLVGEQEAELVPPTDGFYSVVAAKPTSDHYNFEIIDRPNGSSQEFIDQSEPSPFSPSGLLSVALIPEVESTFTYSNGTDINDLPLAELILINDEYMQVYEIDQSIQTIKVYRGMLDTTPANHAIGTPFYGFQSFSVTVPTQYMASESVDVKTITISGLGELDEDTAPIDVFTFVGRAGKPWAPGNVKFEGLAAFVPQGMTTGDLDISWAHRDRTQQTGAFSYQDDGDIGPEVGVTYNLRIYDEDDTLVRTVTGSSANSYAWSTEIADSANPHGDLNSLIRIELEAELGGNVSYNTHNYQFRRADYGFSYGIHFGGFV